MAKQFNMDMLGAWAFIIGLAIALVLALVPTLLTTGWTVLILGLLGIIVGLLNIGDKELQLYLIANIAFLAASTGFSAVLSALPVIGSVGISFLTNFVHNATMFVAPGAAIVALKALYEVSR